MASDHANRKYKRHLWTLSEFRCDHRSPRVRKQVPQDSEILPRWLRNIIMAIALVVIWTNAGTATALTIFTDLASFDAAVGGSTLIDDYNEHTSFSVFADLNPSGLEDRGPYTITELNPVLAYGAGGGDGTGHVSFGFGGPIADFTFDAPVIGIAFDHATTAGDKDLGLSSGAFADVVTSTTTPQFYGVLFDAAVSSVSFENTNSSGNPLDVSRNSRNNNKLWTRTTHPSSASTIGDA